jgi:Flp pilus assembly protein TadG
MPQAMLPALRRFVCGTIRRIHSDATGNAVLELALTLGILGPPLLLGTGATGLIIYDSIEVSNAAHAGAESGTISDNFARDTAQVQAAAKAEAPDLGANLTVATPIVYFACSAALDGTQFSTKAAAQTACANSGLTNNQALEFIQVNTSIGLTPLFKFPGFPKLWTLQGQSVMMVQE